MGVCLSSRDKDGGDENSENRFWVVNINDDGKKICPGVMELTGTSLIFHLKRGGFVKWPYISLVKYGCDSNIFSFVCGTRCQTGEGIFAFKCNRAEELFSLLQCCMQNNRISVISDTDYDTPTGSSTLQRLPYQYDRYPSFPEALSVLSSLQRSEPIGGEGFPEAAPFLAEEQIQNVPVLTEDRMRPRSHLLLTKKPSSGCSSQVSGNSYFEMEEPTLWADHQVSKSYQRSNFIYRNPCDKEELELRGSFYGKGDFGLCDTGYDSDERRDSCLRSLGYENIAALPNESLRSRSLVVSVSSSGSQTVNLVPSKALITGTESQPSTPSVFEEKYILEPKTQPCMNDTNGSRNQLLNRLSLGRDSLTRSDCTVTYFNFDIRQPHQESTKLNYIQVEMESGCDSDSPRTPQSDISVPLVTGQPSEFYTELDLEKTAALSRIHKCIAADDGTRKTRHNSKHFPA
ncbi:fibroblast growth factor receptor substrate 2 [Bombina bombina]|uniref:fibroblast growth factor receptor substrate 2 n=1 Tax=Bombina bombina TaxID=8345 RepID=UPI00235A66E7|nr:fibroblast growth factor receptor substrate 2 [Bombina bombina]